jgi:hypothetical protein
MALESAGLRQQWAADPRWRGSGVTTPPRMWCSWVAARAAVTPGAATVALTGSTENEQFGPQH